MELPEINKFDGRQKLDFRNTSDLVEIDRLFQSVDQFYNALKETGLMFAENISTIRKAAHPSQRLWQYKGKQQ